MDSQWHRDKIDELKHKTSILLWKLNATITGFFAIISLLYLIWYNQNESYIKLVIIILFIIFIYMFSNKIKEFIENINKINNLIDRNYDGLFKRNKEKRYYEL